MASLTDLPTKGLFIPDFPTDFTKKRSSNTRQAIEISPVDNAALQAVIASIRDDGLEAVVSLGKKPAILIDNKAIPIKTLYQPQSLLFSQTKNSTQLQLTARLSLKDASARMKDAKSRDIDMNDPAILALQASMAQVKEQKDANQAIVVTSSKLPNTKNARTALSALKDHRKGMFGGGGGGGSSASPVMNGTIRSTPGSPAVGGSTPQPVKRDAKTIKQEALKRPFIHLLAVRTVSENYMASVLRVSKEDLALLLIKYGKPTFDGSKYNLSDRGYKELDPWAFPYKDESDRQGVIDRAVAAFDRMRISVKDALWQKLMKKEERGTGKILSKLPNLHQGPVDIVKTPKIHLEPSPEDNLASHNTDKSKLLAPSDAINGMVRSKSQEGTKKAGTPTAKSARPKPSTDRTSEVAPSKSQKPVDKKEIVKKVEAKKPVAKKPAARPGTTSTKVKSAEFIEDSDEEIESDELASLQQNVAKKRKSDEDLSSPSKKVDTKKVVKPIARPTPVENVVTKTKPATAPLPKLSQKLPEGDTNGKAQSSNPTTGNKKRIPESQRPVPMARTISAKKNNPKPSPLGSSPPTNASDMEPDKATKDNSTKSSSSSSSGSPLINQRERLQQQAKRQAVQKSASTQNTDRPLKRRANDLDKVSNGRFDTKDSLSSSASSGQASKRPKTGSSHSGSDTDQKSIASDSSNTSPSIVPTEEEIEYARDFKQQWKLYDSELRELQSMDDPPAERVEQAHKLYAKLKAQSDEIWSWEKRWV